MSNPLIRELKWRCYLSHTSLSYYQLKLEMGVLA